MVASFLATLLLGAVTGVLWRTAVIIIMGLMIVWALYNLWEYYDGRRFIGKGALVLAALFGYVFSNGLNGYKVNELVDENKMLKDDLAKYVMENEDIRKEAEACAKAVAEQNKAIVQAEKRARKVEKIAKQSGVNQYRGVKAKAAIETRSANELNAWFENVLSEYK